MFFRKQKEPVIEFRSEHIFIQDESKPVPASKKIPQWYKNLRDIKEKITEKNVEKTIREHRTAKACVPLLDAATAGYILSMPTDILIYSWIDENNEVQVSVQTPTDLEDVITSHSKFQIETHYLAKNNLGIALKLANWFYIKTPPGYSCLFVPHLNSDFEDEYGIRFMSGIVDTDTFHLRIQFPFFLTRITGKDKPILIPRGTPLMQVIPYKRENWTHTIKESDEKHRLKTAFRFKSVFMDQYKSSFWSKKKYR